MDWIFDLLFGWWWYAKGGQEKTAHAAGKFVLPCMIVCLFVGLAFLLLHLMRK